MYVACLLKQDNHVVSDKFNTRYLSPETTTKNMIDHLHSNKYISMTNKYFLSAINEDIIYHV